MKAFICVYRHGIPHPRARAETEEAARADPLLKTFLNQYFNPDCLFDWGDDPAFFAAQHLLGNERAASWGVCRPDVRRQLEAGNFVVFFCGKQNGENPKEWDYYLVGCATAKHIISRHQLWADDQFSPYKAFYNVLARSIEGELIQSETFHPYHDDDWQRRASASYIIFDPDPCITKINLKNPLHVARKGPNHAVEG